MLTYGELDRRARAIGARLHAMGAEGERALIVHPPGLEYIAALFACWQAGAVAVPAYPPRWNRADTRLHGIASDSGARFALTTGAWFDRIEARFDRDADLARLNWVATDRVSEAEGDEFEPEAGARASDPEALALLQYTSGSTSRPKGVVLTHAHFLTNVRAIAQRCELTPDDRVVSWLPPYHDMGLVAGILLPIFVGMEATLMAPGAFLQRPYAWLNAISRFRGTLCGGPNFAYELCVRRLTPAQRESLDLGAWRIAISGAERVRAGTLQRFSESFAPAGFRSTALTPCYGLAEATLGVSLGPIGRGPVVKALDLEALGRRVVEPARAGTTALAFVGCGAPLMDTEVLVVDPDTRLPSPQARSAKSGCEAEASPSGTGASPSSPSRRSGLEPPTHRERGPTCGPGTSASSAAPRSTSRVV